MHDCRVLPTIPVSGCEDELGDDRTDIRLSDKTTISYTAVMGLREDTHLHGQDYSNIAMMFVSGSS